MDSPFPVELWHCLCAFLATHDTCQVVIHQHQGRIKKLDLLETVWDGKEPSEQAGGVPASEAIGRKLTRQAPR